MQDVLRDFYNYSVYYIMHKKIISINRNQHRNPSRFLGAPAQWVGQ